MDLDKKDISDIERQKRYEKRSTDRLKIRESILSQLSKEDQKKTFIIDMIDDYMELWDIKNELIHDIRENGVSIQYQNGANQWGQKKNDSVHENIRVNNQMLTILKTLNLKIEEVDDDNEEFTL